MNNNGFLRDSRRHKAGREVEKDLPTNAREMRPKPYLRPHNVGLGGNNVMIKRVAWVEYRIPANNEWIEVPALFFHTRSDDGRYLSLTSDTILEQVIGATGEEDPNKWPEKSICIHRDIEVVRREKVPVIRVKPVDQDLPPAYQPPPTTDPNDPLNLESSNA